MDIGEFKLVEMDIQKSRSCSLSALDDLGGQMLCWECMDLEEDDKDLEKLGKMGLGTEFN